MMVSVGSGAAAAAGASGANGGGRGARRKLRARLAPPSRLFWNAGMLDGAAAAAPAKYPDSHISCSRFSSVASCCS